MHKYYLHKEKKSFYPYDSYEKFILRNSPIEEVRIDENIDSPSITILLNKLKEKCFNRPKNDEYNKFKEIQKDDFYNYLSVSIDALKSLKWKEAEIYYNKPYASRNEVVLFSNHPKNRFRIDIELDSDIEWAEVEIRHSYSFTRRPYYRKNAISISLELFSYLFHMIIIFLEDNCNYRNNFSDLLKNFELSIQGKIKPKVSNEQIDISPLISELSNQIRQIESRLMSNDNDKRETREKLRGRIEGLKSAIAEIKSFLNNID